MITAASFPSSRRGFALVLVLWCLMLLGLAVFAVVEGVSLAADHASHEQLALEARALAASGAALGQVAQLLPDDPLLRQETSPGHGFTVTIESEGGRLNLNYLLLTQHQDVILNLFTSWGMETTDAQRAVDCLYDWVTPGDLASLDGAKARDYEQAGLPQRPSHQPFRSWAEVGQVIGVDRVATARPNWQDSFTLWSEGPLDLSTAPADRIAAFFGVPASRVQALVTLRNGRDGLAGTRDDAPLNPEVIKSQLGLTDLQMTALQGQYVLGSSVRRIESTGQAGDARAAISVIEQVNASNVPQYFVWSER